MIGLVNPGINIHNRLKSFAFFMIKRTSLQRLQVAFRPQIMTVEFAMIVIIAVAADLVKIVFQS